MTKVQPYNNQYLITNQDVPFSMKEWKAVKMGNKILQHSPNLSIFSNEQVILLGFAIHVLHPNWNEEDILKAFPTTEPEQLDFMDHLCGIHLIIIKRGNQTHLYNDAAGVMKMFVLQDTNSHVVGSDPKLIGEVAELIPDISKEAQDFYSSDFFQKSCIRLGEQTEFTNVKQVLPNHSLNLDSMEVDRYFPRTVKETHTIEEALNNTQKYFTNTLSAANRKYNLKCSMTAGWDSRMVLAMTKDLHQDIEYYTFMLPFFNDKHEDVKIPTKMASTLGLKHNFVPKNITLDQDSLAAVKSSFELMKYERIDTYFGGFPKYLGAENALLLGTVSEICKNYYDDVNLSDGASFAKAAHFPVLPYTVKHFEQKLTELKELENQYGYDLRDIAHWEQDITNFAAKRTQYLYSFVRAFSPFNSRIVIRTILSVPREMRDKQQHEFYRLYLKKFYPELLQFPVNPSLKQQFIRLGKKIGVYGIYKKLSTQIRK
jgi:hypothetical protein